MIVEHVAWQVADPQAVADWYVRHLFMRVVRQADPPGTARFLADATGRVLLEIYRNPTVAVPDYPATNPLTLHLAFATDDVAGQRDRLVAAGASVVQAHDVTPAGDTMAMLRDPWGFPVQLVKRKTPMGSRA